MGGAWHQITFDRPRGPDVDGHQEPAFLRGSKMSGGFWPRTKTAWSCPPSARWWKRRTEISGPGAMTARSYRCTPDGLQTFRPKDALAEQPIYSLLAEADGTIWAGTFRGGLLRFKNGGLHAHHHETGVAGGRHQSNSGRPAWPALAGDPQGNLLGRQSGAERLCGRAHQFAGLCVLMAGTTACRRWNVPTATSRPAGAGADGRLWFTTVRGVVWVNPDELTAAAPPPPVLIEELRVDGESVSSDMGQVASDRTTRQATCHLSSVARHSYHPSGPQAVRFPVHRVEF